MAYIQVIAHEHSSEAMELPLEDDLTMDLATLTSQYPNAIGLKYKAESGAWRGLKVHGTTVSHPGGDWSETIKYVVTYNMENKRKADNPEADYRPKRSNLLEKPTDLVVLNMPYDVNEEKMREYFERYGELSFIQLKKKSDGTSRGYGFVRYIEMDDQRKCLDEMPHRMDDRILEVKIPQSKAAGFEDVVQFTSGAQRLSRRIHVSNVTARITRKDLQEYFEKFGPVTDVFMPKETETRKNPMFAFVTFDNENDARTLVESSKPHMVHGDTLNVAFASPIVKDSGPKKPADEVFQEIIENFITQAYAGKLGGEKPRSRSEAKGLAMGFMKRYLEIQGGPTSGSYSSGGYDDHRNGRVDDRYRHQDIRPQETLSSGWGGNAAMAGYGLPTSFATSGTSNMSDRYPPRW